MKKLKRFIIIFLILSFILTLLGKNIVLARNTESVFSKVEYTDAYKKWLELSDEEKEKVIEPRKYEVPYTKKNSNNLLYRARLLGANLNTGFSLKEVISKNVKIKNQGKTNSCWAFAAMSSLETNLAMQDHSNEIGNSKEYDFSEMHMLYATSRSFKNNEQNPLGFNRNFNEGANWLIAETYLTNGLGAIPETEMKFEDFENNEDTIEISEIQNKTVSTTLYDTVDFPDYKNSANKAEIMNEIKTHIQTNGAVFAQIHGSSFSADGTGCYRNDTGALYCENNVLYTADHAVSIIGWNDGYSKDNFSNNQNKPTEDGAWIIRNSWGEKAEVCSVIELKQLMFNNYPDKCREKGWNSASEITDEFVQEFAEEENYIIEDGKVYIKVGDNGFMYVSYEDDNISRGLYGIEKASDNKDYKTIYQYDELYPANMIELKSSKILLSNIFEKKSSETENLTQVSIYAPHKYTCRVYVNPNGQSMKKSDMQLVTLKAGDGESETFNAGYHTLEFASPVEIKGNNFVVAIEVTSYETKYNETTGKYEPITLVKLESKYEDEDRLNCVNVENGKCFVSISSDLDNCTWIDLGTELSQNGLLNGDSTIKAFTVSNTYDGSLKNIEIVTPPTKTSYYEGEDFDKTGMVVIAHYNREENPDVTLNDSDYSISNGTNLVEGQTITITYDGKSVNLEGINIEKNSVIEISIDEQPTKMEYTEGQNFDKTGMVVKAKYKNGDIKEIQDYTVTNGNNLKPDQDGFANVIISYEGKTVELKVSVTPNPLVAINITKEPDKTTYIEGQNFDKTGMTVIGTYENGDTHEIIDYTIINGDTLKPDQDGFANVIISYDNKTVELKIKVEIKSVVNISISKKPTKVEYIQNKENLDLSGGKIKIEYNDNTSEEIDLTSSGIEILDFNNKNIGKNTITVKYQNKTTTFDVEIVREAVPEKSNFDNSNCDIVIGKLYTYNNIKNKQEYMTIELEINNITKAEGNDSYEYYYYVSSNKNDENINNWIKISNGKIVDGKLKVILDTREISNYSEINNSNETYLYIKEVVTKGGNQTINVSKPFKLETTSDEKLEIYIDDEKISDISTIIPTNPTNNNPRGGETIKPSSLPDTGIRSAMILITLILLTIGGIGYLKYKKLSKYIK